MDSSTSFRNTKNCKKYGGQRIFSPNEWEEVKKKDNKTIQKWIDDNMEYRSCVIVFIGENTSNNRWVKYEIKKAWMLKKGIFGINIHNLKNQYGEACNIGINPFEIIKLKDGTSLADKIDTYNPRDVAFINSNMEPWIENAIRKVKSR